VKRLARMIEAAAMVVTLRVAMFAIPTRRRTLVPAGCLVSALNERLDLLGLKVRSGWASLRVQLNVLHELFLRFRRE